MKIPVGDTIEGAFSFAFRSFLSVLGTIWFPFLVAGAILGGAAYLLHPDWNAFLAPKKDPAATLAALRAFGPLYALGWLVLIVTTAMVRVGLMRKALGLHEGPVFIYYSLGPAVWRLIGAYILLSVIFVVLITLDVLGCAALVAMSNSAIPSPWCYLADAVAVVAAVVAPIYVVVRTVFFVPAVVVAEDRIGIGRSWELGGSNVLRIILITLTIFVCVNFVFGMVSMFFMPPFPVFSVHLDPQVVAKWELGLFRNPALVGVFVLQGIVLSALNVGAQARAYRALNAEGHAS
jgi:hypothetical protein